MLPAPLDQCDVYYYRGEVHSDGGDDDKAIKDFDSAIELCPDYSSAYLSRGSIHHKRGNHWRAIADWRAGDELGIRLYPDQ